MVFLVEQGRNGLSAQYRSILCWHLLPVELPMMPAFDDGPALHRLTESCRWREDDSKQPTVPLSQSGETLRSPEWTSSLAGPDSAGISGGADSRFPRHSICHLAWGY